MSTRKDRVTLTIADGVAHVRLNRAEKLNALDPDMFMAIDEVGADLAANAGVRAVVLSGDGPAFCAGLDIERVVGTTTGQSILPFADLTERTHGMANWAQHIVLLWRQLPVPVLAAIHGVAFGGGLQLALGADIRYVAPGTRLSIVETKWGLVPDMAGTQLARYLAPEDIIRELTYTARDFSGEEAVAFGLATRMVSDPLSEAMATAREIAGRSPDAIRAAKRLLNHAVTCDTRSGLIAETDEQGNLLGQPNQVEAVRANLENRRPAFCDPKTSGCRFPSTGFDNCLSP